MEVKDSVLKKWEFLIKAAKDYWIDSIPTGLSDDVFNQYEAQAAREDGFFVRDYIYDVYSKGTRSKNQDVDKISKFKVNGGTMLDGIIQAATELGLAPEDLYCDLKYDGSSIAIYLDPTTGIPKRCVTVGNLNIDSYGIDQTWKLIKLLPNKFPKGIRTIQAEALIDTNRLGGIDPEKARQKANGLINSKYLEGEVTQFLTLRAYRYWTEPGYFTGMNYREVLESLPTKKSKVDGHVMFAPAQTWTLAELKGMPGFTETDKTITRDGTFLNDGWVLYNPAGQCQRALKFAGAGSGTEAIKTRVQGLQWNDQGPKGKDSWSANVIIDPVVIKGCTVRKPSAGSVSKLLKGNITPGAEVGIILANSTIPMVGEVFQGGDGNYQWPTCACGHTMGPGDIYGSNLKCGNPACTERKARMAQWLNNNSLLKPEDLNSFLVIDRFKWENTKIDLQTLFGAPTPEAYHDYLESFLKTALQKRNLELVWRSSWEVLHGC